MSSNFLALALDPDVCRDFPSQRPDVGAQGHHGGYVMGNGNVMILAAGIHFIFDMVI